MDLLQLLTAEPCSTANRIPWQRVVSILPEKEVRGPDPQKMNGVSKKQGLGNEKQGSGIRDQGLGKISVGGPLSPIPYPLSPSSSPSSIRRNPQVTGITQDSRCVQPGFVFVCISGYQLDGHDYVEDAIRRGAVAVVIERELPGGGGETCPCPPVLLSPSDPPVWVRVKNGREALALLSAAFYRYPSRSLRVIGITGTNGKTTTSCLVASILEAAGFSVGLTNTLTCRIKKAGSACSEETAAVRTTPESVDLQRTLRQMVDQGCQYAVVEVSSHSLALNRVLGCEFDVGVLTNITSDHMDFHKTFVEYRQAKMRLFSELGWGGEEESEKVKGERQKDEGRREVGAAPCGCPHGEGVKRPKAAVLNLDDPSFSVIEESTSVPVFSYGFQTGAQIRADRIIPSRSGIAFEVHIRALPVAATGGGSRSVHTTGADKESAGGEVRGAEQQNAQCATRDAQYFAPSVASTFKRLEAASTTEIISASTMEIISTLTGLHNVSNILAAIGVGLAEGIDPAKIQGGIRKVSPVPGRFETIDCGQDFWVVVDFAHTADALQNLLQTARHLGPAKIMTVFGCGGDRDISKRFPMGQVAATLSDRLIITNDNSRSEDPAAIARQIEDGVCSVEGYGRSEEAAAPDIAKSTKDTKDTKSTKGHEEHEDKKGRELAPVAMERRAPSNIGADEMETTRCHGMRFAEWKPLVAMVCGSLDCKARLQGSAVPSTRPLMEDIGNGAESLSAGQETGQEKYEIILDRYQAIQRALSWAEPGDMVLIAGKGHEQHQIIGSQCIPFDDRQVARHILNGMKRRD